MPASTPTETSFHDKAAPTPVALLPTATAPAMEVMSEVSPASTETEPALTTAWRMPAVTGVPSRLVMTLTAKVPARLVLACWPRPIAAVTPTARIVLSFVASTSRAPLTVSCGAALPLASSINAVVALVRLLTAMPAPTPVFDLLIASPPP